MAVHCRQCGRSNQDGREFCFSCGAFLEWAGEQVDQSAPRIVPVAPGPTVESGRQTIRRLSISLSPGRLSVTPGERASLLVTVGNFGSIVEGADLYLAGLPDEWWTFDPPRVTLLPSTEAKATLRIHPPRTIASTAGDYPIAVDVAAQLDRKASAEATITCSTLRAAHNRVETREFKRLWQRHPPGSHRKYLQCSCRCLRRSSR